MSTIITTAIKAGSIANSAGTGPVTLTAQKASQAHGTYDGTGSVAILESNNLSSMTDVNVGRYRMAFTNSFANATYGQHGAGSNTGSSGWGNFVIDTLNTTTTTAQIGCGNLDYNQWRDNPFACMATMGILA
jgi:hypothetical protein